MSKITRAEVLAKYQVALQKIKELENKKYDYKTDECFMPVVESTVSGMNMDQLMQTAMTLKDVNRNLDECMKEYGITKDDLSNDMNLYLGHTLDEWANDIKVRIEEIRNDRLLGKYEQVVKTLKNNFSDDDKFSLDMDEIDALGVSLD